MLCLDTRLCLDSLMLFVSRHSDVVYVPTLMLFVSRHSDVFCVQVAMLKDSSKRRWMLVYSSRLSCVICVQVVIWILKNDSRKR